MADHTATADVEISPATTADGVLDISEYAEDVLVEIITAVDGELQDFIEPLFNQITISVVCGFIFRGALVMPAPPESASQTNPAQATGHLVRPMFGISVFPTGGTPQ